MALYMISSETPEEEFSNESSYCLFFAPGQEDLRVLTSFRRDRRSQPELMLVTPAGLRLRSPWTPVFS